MALAGNDMPTYGKPMSDADLQSVNGMGAWTLTQTNFSTGTYNVQSSEVSGFPNLTSQPWTSQGTQTQNLDPNTVNALKTVFSFFIKK
jgi:hypothetical protein